MDKNKLSKFVLMPVFLLALTSCNNKSSDGTVTDLYAVSASTIYSVGDIIKNDNFVVAAKYSDNTTKEIKDGYTVEPALPYTFKNEDIEKGVDFNFSYKDKKTSIRFSVIPQPSEDEAQITFKEYNGTVLTKENIKKGEEITYKGKYPSKPKQGSEVFNVFIGWDKQLGLATENKEFNAVYKTLDKYVDEDHDGIPLGVDTDDKDNYFEAEVKEMVTVDTNIKIDFSKFLKKDANTTYDNELAKLGLFLSTPHINFKDGLFNHNAYGSYENAMYARLGCDDWKHFDFKDEAREYTYDKFDTTSGTVAHKYLFNDDGSIAKDLIIIAFEGTNGKNRWASNFDVGDDSSEYYQKIKKGTEKGDKTDHPEWDFKNYHKGFFVAARRVLTEKVDGDTKDGPVQFLKYIDEHSKNSNGEPIIFITGHSRGGAMATILGEYFENHYEERQKKKCIPFTYTFAAPAAWGGNSAKPQTSTVFNVINEDDLVVKVPFSGWGFNRLGDDELTKSVYKEYKTLYDQNPEGRIYDYIKNADSIFANLGCESRKEIYQFSGKYVSSTAVNEDSYETEELANAGIKDTIRPYYVKQLGNFTNFIDFKPYKNALTEKWDVYPDCCIGTITALAAAAMTNDPLVMTNIKDVLPLVNNPKFLELILSIGFNILGGGADTIKLPHDYGAYHIILREYKGK